MSKNIIETARLKTGLEKKKTYQLAQQDVNPPV